MKFVWVFLYRDTWVNYTIDITWTAGYISVLVKNLFINRYVYFLIKKKFEQSGLKRLVVETGRENESYTIKWQYDMIPSCEITASRKKNMSCIVRCVQKERHFDHRFLLYIRRILTSKYRRTYWCCRNQKFQKKTRLGNFLSEFDRS